MSIVTEEPPVVPAAVIVAASWALVIAGVLIGVWAMFDWEPYPTSTVVCLGASASAVVLALMMPGWFGLFSDKRPGARGVGTLFLAPLIGFIFEAAFQVKLLRLASDLMPAIAGAAAGGLGGYLWSRHFQGNWRSWPLMAVLGLLVGCATFEELDMRLDHAPPQTFRVPVDAGYSTTHRGAASYFLTLPPWGPNKESDDVEVSSDLYNNLEPGQTVCVTLHPGYLGARWIVVGLCPSTG